MKNIILPVTIFISGAVIMVIELLGTRILAPYFGGNIYVLTGIIAVILFFLSLGYWAGGKIADKKSNENTLSLIIYISSIVILITFSYREWILSFINNTNIDYKFGAILASIILFGPINVLLGCISPYVVKLKIKKISKAGAVSGNLYAIGTLGSIFGTLLAGFILIPMFEISKIIYLLSSTVFLNSFFVGKKSTIKLIFFILILTLLFLINNFSKIKIKNLILDVNSQYQNIRVYQDNQKKIRYLVTNLFIN